MIRWSEPVNHTARALVTTRSDTARRRPGRVMRATVPPVQFRQRALGRQNKPKHRYVHGNPTREVSVDQGQAQPRPTAAWPGIFEEEIS